MGYIVRMPQMGYEMDEGEVVDWEYDEGDTVSENEIIVVVESEKATNEVTAREDGVLRRIVVPEGGTVEPGTPIGIVADADEDISEYEAELDDATSDPGAETSETAGGDGTAASSGGATGTGRTGGHAAGRDSQHATEIRASPGARELAGEKGVDLAAVEGTGPQGVITEDDVVSHALEASEGRQPGNGTGRTLELPEEPIDTAPPNGVQASPGARQLASRAGVDLTAVDGTGPRGVVTEADVRDAVDSGGSGAATGAAPSPSTDRGTTVETGASRTVTEARDLSRVQQTVSDRLSESYRNAVHVTTKRTFDAGPLQAVTEAAGAAGLNVSITDLLVKSVGAELAVRPEFNALFEDGTHKLVGEVNVGVAVDVDAGLVVPVVPTVTEKSTEEVAAVRDALTERALGGEYTSEELSGGTFTITNLGPFGVDSFDPVINPPEVAILGVGRVREDGTMTLSLSFDHRVVNGADAARFLGGLVETLTDPLALEGFFETDVLAAEGVDVSLSVDPDD